MLNKFPAYVFMQDNAAIHTVKKVKKWFEDMAIELMDWPPYSPDLNPIEHVQVHLKRMVLRLHPELEVCTGKTEEDIKNLETALRDAWQALPDSLFESLEKSMERRVAAVLAAKGQHTKY